MLELDPLQNIDFLTADSYNMQSGKRKQTWVRAGLMQCYFLLHRTQAPAFTSRYQHLVTASAKAAVLKLGSFSGCSLNAQWCC